MARAGAKKQDRKRAAEDDNDSAGDEPQTKKVKQQFVLSKEPKKDDDGNPYWEISNKRRVQVSEFKGATLVSIREYFDKDGKTLPGKGISLTVEQWNVLSELLPDIESALQAKDFKVTRPQYPDSQSKSSTKSARKHFKEDADDDDDEPDIKPMLSTKGKLDKFRLKANHEETSEEDG